MKVEDPTCGECIHFSHFLWKSFSDLNSSVYKCNGRNRAVHPQTHWCCDESVFELRAEARNRYKELWSSAVAHSMAGRSSVEDAISDGDDVVRMIIEHDDWEKRVERLG